MSQTVRFAVSLDAKLLENFDTQRLKQGYETRSEAVRDLIRHKLISDNWAQHDAVMGTITLVYDHHATELPEKLTSIQHNYHAHILSTMHLHLDHHHCLEVIAVKGTGKDIQTLADKLISVKGVKHGKLTATAIGQDF